MLHRWSWSLQVVISMKECSPKQKDMRSYMAHVRAHLMKVGSYFASVVKSGGPNPSMEYENQNLMRKF